MKRHTIYTLLDGSNHEERREAIAHCDEMIGAEMRDIFVARSGATLEDLTRALVRGEFDSNLLAVGDWIKEKNEIKNHTEEG